MNYRNSQFCTDHNWLWTKPCNDQIKAAVAKGNSISQTDNIRAAVEIVYIYTSDKPETYKEVNAYMRGDKINSADITMFKKYVDLLYDSYNLLCIQLSMYCQSPNVVFRGQSFIPSTIGSFYTFESFISTSKSMKIAQGFANGKIIFTIKGIKGLAVDTFTAEQGEEEVLVKPPFKLRVDTMLRKKSDLSKIQTLINKYNGGNDIPDVYVEGTVVHDTSDVNKGNVMYETCTFLTLSFAMTCMHLLI